MTSTRLRYAGKILIHGTLERVMGVKSAWTSQRPSLSIFTYHSFCRVLSESRVSAVPAAMFERHVRWLKSKYRLVSLADGLSCLSDYKNSARPLATITIDDGFADNFHVAWPVLREHSIPATIFVATDFVDNQRLPWPTRLRAILDAIQEQNLRAPTALTDAHADLSHQRMKAKMAQLSASSRFTQLNRLAAAYDFRALPARPALSWDQLREMASVGIEVGSHTVFHGMLPYLSDLELTAELVDSKQRIEEELQRECRYLAYPNGDYDERVAARARQLSYQAALTQSCGVNLENGDVYALRRIEVPSHDPFQSFCYRARRALLTSL